MDALEGGVLTDKQIQDAFARIDADGSGGIDVDELALALAEIGFVGLPLGDLKALFDQMDADGSGAIDIEEFSGMIRDLPPPGSPERAKKSLLAQVMDSMETKMRSEEGWRELGEHERAASWRTALLEQNTKVKLQVQEVSYTVEVGEGNGDEIPAMPSSPESELKRMASPVSPDFATEIPDGMQQAEQPRGSTRKILHGVSGTFLPGQLVALMGPSGAGKTTLMNVLTNNCGHTLVGDVLVNGKKMEQGFRAFSNLVPQDDVMLGGLTPRETLRYAARLRMPRHLCDTEKGRNEKVERILSTLGLQECADTMVGSADHRGISGGQRKRLSIGLELLDDKPLLLLDEPTSGLDSKAAEDVIRVLRDLTAHGRTVVCTIHQPSWTVFCSFHVVFVLAKGRVVYDGPPHLVPEYAEALSESHARVDWAPPKCENPVDHFMRIIQDIDDGPLFAEEWARPPDDDLKCETYAGRVLPQGKALLVELDKGHRLRAASTTRQPSKKLRLFPSTAQLRATRSSGSDSMGRQSSMMAPKQNTAGTSATDAPSNRPRRRGVEAEDVYTAPADVDASTVTVPAMQFDKIQPPAPPPGTPSKRGGMMAGIRREATAATDSPRQPDSPFREREMSGWQRVVTIADDGLQSRPLRLSGNTTFRGMGRGMGSARSGRSNRRTQTVHTQRQMSRAPDKYNPTPEDTLPPLPLRQDDRSYPVDYFTQWKVLIGRQLYDAAKDKRKFVAGLLLKTCIGLLAGISWFGAGRPCEFGTRGRGALSIDGVMFLLCFTTLQDNILPTAVGFPSVRALLMREYKNGYYASLPWFLSYYIGSLTIQLSYLLVLTVVVYSMVGLRIDVAQAPFVFLASILFISAIGCALGIAIGTTSADLKSAQQKIVPLLGPMILFSGFVIPYDEIPIYLRWLYYCSLVQYGMAALKANQFGGLEFADSPVQVMPAQSVTVDVAGSNHTVLIPAQTAAVSGDDWLEETGVKDTRFTFVFLAAYMIASIALAYFFIRRQTLEKLG